MSTVYVAHLKGRAELLLLAEAGLDERSNVAFDPSGRTVTYGHARFDPSSEQEIDLDSPEITAVQRRAYERHIERDDRFAWVERVTKALEMAAAQHPFRQGADRFGGTFLPRGFYSWVDTLEKLEGWLLSATEEDVVGDIGTYAGTPWIETSVPDENGTFIGARINADTRARGVAPLLVFVKRCGGPGRVRAQRSGGTLRLRSVDGDEVFEGAEYLYLYHSP
ncbi:hypothetical protein [Vulgatibacter incomptus]|uniref:hypothetical protein n=1 Tax=Vulgatibacter incomptus TaxID=1391653 RepID=UPI0012F845F0|nr:hypothetical protein [Vulgatibacter incomptus]